MLKDIDWFEAASAIGEAPCAVAGVADMRLAFEPLLVTAALSSPLAGDPPNLDSLMQNAVSIVDGGVRKSRVDKTRPVPEFNDLPIPIAHVQMGEWLVPRCSLAIFSTEHESVEHIEKHLDPQAELLHESQRKVIAAASAGFMRRRFVPRRTRLCRKIAWFCLGNRNAVLDILQAVRSIGLDAARGYGAVAKWDASPAEADYSLFAPNGADLVLMRPVPAGERLPPNLAGYVLTTGSCCAPYWHPARYTEILFPI